MRGLRLGRRARMPAEMILLRHGQSLFNLHFTRTRQDPGLVDPALTEAGERQAGAAAEALCARSGQSPIARIVASPYRRALQTAQPIATRLGLPVEVRRLVRERFAFACDIGSPREALQRDWPRHDFGDASGLWWHDQPPDEDGRHPPEPEASVLGRAAEFRAEMVAWEAANPGVETLVVAHWGFLLALSGRSLENGSWITVDPARALDGPVVWRH